MQLLLGEKNVNIDRLYENGDTPLWYAVRHNSTAIAKLLVERHASMENTRGESLLCFAASLGRTAIVELLLGLDNIDPNTKCNRGLTPLMAAAQGGHEEVVQLLLERNDVEIDTQDLGQDTALTHAALHEHDEIVRLLLKRGVSAEFRDSVLEAVSRLVRQDTRQEVIIKLLREYQA